jgi:hypothetical protein
LAHFDDAEEIWLGVIIRIGNAAVLGGTASKDAGDPRGICVTRISISLIAY